MPKRNLFYNSVYIVLKEEEVEDKDDINSFDHLLEVLDKDNNRIVIQKSIRKYNKPVTIIRGFQDIRQISNLAKELKKRIGTGGTTKGEVIILQGDHRETVMNFLLSKGFKSDLIEVI
jgi:translation initiation factor 1